MIVVGCDLDEVHSHDLPPLGQTVQQFQPLVIEKPAMAGRAGAGRDRRIKPVNVDRDVVANTFWNAVQNICNPQLAKLPDGMGWLAVYGVALLAGIGFTMSLFIGTLAFEQGNFEHTVATRVGVLTGSLLSAIAGFTVLKRSLDQPHETEDIPESDHETP